MILKLKYGKKFEINRIKSTLAKLEWYKSRGYKPLLLKNIIDERKIEEYVERDFEEKDYKDKGEELVKQFLKVKEIFISKLKSFIKTGLPKEIDLIVTKYGVGGSYSPPNRIVVNILGNQANKPLLEVLKHEIIHLLVEDEIVRRKLSHRDKEQFVKDIETNII
mgnify:FL=1